MFGIGLWRVRMNERCENMNKHIWWAWALKNSISIVCWTILAIYFNKWWIALFAALFLSSLSTENRKDDKDGN